MFVERYPKKIFQYLFFIYSKRNTRKFRIAIKYSFILFVFWVLKAIYYSFQVYENNTPYELYSEKEPVSSMCNPYNRKHENTIIINGIQYPHKLPLSLNSTINFDCLNKFSSIKRILIWNRFFATEDYKENTNILSQGNCPVSNCEITHDLSKLNTSDMVYVYMGNSYPNKLPLNRPSRQKWIFGVYESPIHTRDFKLFDSYFNLTSTYYIDSDFPNFYSNYFFQHFLWQKNVSYDQKFDYSQGKNGFAYGLISNCHGSSKRLDLIYKLRKYIPVDVYGRCGKPCPVASNCREYLTKRFKFYLAFENSLCKLNLIKKRKSIYRV